MDIEDCVVTAAHDLAEETEQNLIVEKVRQVLAEMNPDYRKVLELAFFQGLTHNDIAEKTGQPLGTVKTRIRAGLQQLRAKFAG